MKRGCEEMKNHFFTPRFFYASMVPSTKSKGKRVHFPLSPKNQLFKIKLLCSYVLAVFYGICTG